MKFIIDFDLENDAFRHRPEKETARILRDIAGKIEAGRVYGKVLDVNGNSCGNWEFTD